LDLAKRYEGKTPRGVRTKTYSVNRGKINSDIWTENAAASRSSVSFIAIDKNKEMTHFHANVLGRHNIQNILAAILTAKELGMHLDEIAEACKNIRQEQAGMVFKNGKHGIGIVDSSYSSNPDGVIADLEYLSILSGKKIVVMPCLIELGEKSKEAHQKIGEKIGKVCDLAIITTKERFEDIKKGAIYSGMKEKNIVFCENLDDIYSLITILCTAGDAVLLEGRVPAGLLKLLV
jgi:UDP-N-acetylmuramoyl-tripeptide--D-alanyl-D-alanine ligase